MATTKAIEANAIKNSGATVLNGGSVPSTATRVTKVLGIETLGYHSGKAGSIVPNDTTQGIYPANNLGNFAKMVPGKYIAVKQTSEIAGIANTAILFGSNVTGRSIKSSTTRYTSFLVSYSSVGGEGGPETTYTYSNKVLDFGADNAAEPTRAIPGELTYLKNGKVPTNDDYKARTN
jgi:hypothetical protein